MQLVSRGLYGIFGFSFKVYSRSIALDELCNTAFSYSLFLIVILFILVKGRKTSEENERNRPKSLEGFTSKKGAK